jgi:chemotaxis protein MotB
VPPNATPAERERIKVDNEIVRALRASGLGALPHIEVTVTGDGLLVSLTDELNFSMFASASAQPRPELVVAMEKIGKVLAAHPGSLIVRGHTDNRPFKSTKYDNWRLSTARAHIAYHMLVRGGLPETRFERVEGYADRSPKLPKTPEAAHNRRIEILLREPKR